MLLAHVSGTNGSSTFATAVGSSLFTGHTGTGPTAPSKSPASAHPEGSRDHLRKHAVTHFCCCWSHVACLVKSGSVSCRANMMLIYTPYYAQAWEPGLATCSLGGHQRRAEAPANRLWPSSAFAVHFFLFHILPFICPIHLFLAAHGKLFALLVIIRGCLHLLQVAHSDWKLKLQWQ